MELNEAKNLSYHQTVWVIGHYMSTGEATRVRVNGQVKTWKTRPAEIRIPFKYGLKEYGYITEDNIHLFTLVQPDPVPRNEVKIINSKFRGV